MVHHKLVMWLKISYFHLAMFALLPTTLKLRSPLSRRFWRRVRASRIYVLYSFFCTCLVFIELPFLVPHNIFTGYMSRNIVLQSGFFVNLSIRMLGILGCYGFVWLFRSRLLQLFGELAAHWRFYGPLLQRLVGARALEHLELSLAALMRRKLGVIYGLLAASAYVQYILIPAATGANFVAMCMTLSHMVLLNVASIGFYTILLLLYHQFESVNLALLRLYETLCCYERSGKLYYSMEEQRRCLNHLRRTADLHSDCYCLARRFFCMYDVPNATLFLNMFSTTIYILYHAVQFSNSTINPSIWGMLAGQTLVTLNFWNSCLLMNMVDGVLCACNDTGQRLRQFTDLQLFSNEFEKELQRFASNVRDHRLVYKICRCVELNKPACLSFLCTALLQVIVLMQFDMGQKRFAPPSPSSIPMLPVPKQIGS
ncbi:putative gustatory receptor 58b [Scaptodrosophila lebanonensis]|uniref:Gustatory receptor n=1 Tax=Drosophila lebanonensis TaxID=7225 RepID=A0A6J2THW8_DROLE|nr:putative gustatory receptor 58b [Scaptodrosophila lebanonensis]